MSKAARDAGHSVAFCASGYIADALARKGARVYSTPASTMLGLPAPLSRILEKRSQSASLPVREGKDFGSIWLVLVGTGMARRSYLRKLVRAVLDALADFRADMVFTEMDPGGVIAARVARLPLAVTYGSPLQVGIGTFPWKLVRRAYRDALAVHGHAPLDPEQLMAGGDVLKIVPSIPELEDLPAGAPDVAFVGSLLEPIPPPPGAAFEPEPERRYVFAYLGTGSVSLEKAEPVLARVFPHGSTRTCVVGAQSVREPRRTGNLHVLPFVSASQILPHCDFTLCHGGHNTLVESLSHGVPLVVFPGPIFERRYNARKIAERKAGVWGELSQFEPRWLGEVLERREQLREGARSLGDSIRAAGGGRGAVDAMQRWLARVGGADVQSSAEPAV